MKKNKYEMLYRLDGLQTVDTIMDELNIGRQSAVNLISKLKKEQHLTIWAGGRKKIYKITIRKQLPRVDGMWDVINRYSHKMKLNPWYDHQVHIVDKAHGVYGPEDALIDAIETKSFRIILASLHLFRHIKNWKKLYSLSMRYDSWQKVGALYETARLFLKIKKMPEKYIQFKPNRWHQLTQLKKKNFSDIANRWKIYIPFNKNDIKEIQ
ncbi:MAG: hypothetical protein ABIG89_05905 [Candidatus Woesearchaeota archaeon]